jgi:anaerobic magnesium-protoporphyrin IX monomethyl ester cyclase
MRVLLIEPPAESKIVSNNPPIIDDERGCNPPLGILYLAGYMEQMSDHRVNVLDCEVEGIGHRELQDAILKRSPEIVGIHSTTFTLVDALLTAQAVKDLDPQIPVVMGGPHPSIYPVETAGLPGIDYIVLGEGEISFTELVDRVSRGVEPVDVPGIVYNRNGDTINTGPRLLIDDLDTLPFPARHLVPYEDYWSVIANRSPITTMITSRGCPYGCSFCGRPHLGKKFRARSAPNVVDEMASCVKMGIREFLIYDDTFTVDKRRVMGICDEIIHRKLDIGWDIRARVDTVDDEMLRKLKDANCERIHYGVESGSDDILKILKKGITVKQVKRAFRLTRQHGIRTLAYFMFGSPGESREDILNSIALIRELKPDYIHVTITTPFPASELYESGLRDGTIIYDFWRSFAEHPKADFQPLLSTESLPRDVLNGMVEMAYKSFYTRPGYVLKELARLRSLGQLLRKARAGVHILRLGEGRIGL